MVPPDFVLSLRHAYDVDGFSHAWSKGAEEGLFRSHCRAGGPTAAEGDAFFGRRLMLRLLSSLSILLLLLSCSFVGDLSLSLMCFKV